jgi:hypothetical protein
MIGRTISPYEILEKLGEGHCQNFVLPFGHAYGPPFVGEMSLWLSGTYGYLHHHESEAF